MQTILIIDDDRDMCLLLKRFLTRHGYEVLEAYNGKKALELLESTEPSLVMCDFRLEDMEGNVLLGKIKERYPHLPVIIITGYSDIKIAVEVMKMGAYDYITKPLFPDEILVTIKKGTGNQCHGRCGGSRSCKKRGAGNKWQQPGARRFKGKSAGNYSFRRLYFWGYA